MGKFTWLNLPECKLFCSQYFFFLSFFSNAALVVVYFYFIFCFFFFFGNLLTTYIIISSFANRNHTTVCLFYIRFKKKMKNAKNCIRTKFLGKIKISTEKKRKIATKKDQMQRVQRILNHYSITAPQFKWIIQCERAQVHSIKSTLFDCNAVFSSKFLREKEILTFYPDNLPHFNRNTAWLTTALTFIFYCLHCAQVNHSLEKIKVNSPLFVIVYGR